MHENEIPATAVPKRIPWNKGKLIGPRPPLRQKHVWAIRTRLQIERQVRELALFNLAIDRKLRGTRRAISEGRRKASSLRPGNDRRTSEDH